MKKYFLLIILSFIELIACLFIYSLNEGFWHELRINWIGFSIKQFNFNLYNYFSMSIYYFITSIFMEGFKVFLLYFISIIIYNSLVFNNLVKNNIIISILFFESSFLILSYIFDKDFYFIHNLNNTINSLLSIIITSIFISKITKRIMRLIN
jgi:hypothetical protein